MGGWLVFVVPEIQSYSKWIEPVGGSAACDSVLTIRSIYLLWNSKLHGIKQKLKSPMPGVKRKELPHWQGRRDRPLPKAILWLLCYKHNFHHIRAFFFYKAFIWLHIFHCVNYKLICLVLNDSHSHTHRVNCFSHKFRVYISKRSKIYLVSPQHTTVLGLVLAKWQ